jgi:hemoglobin
MTEEEEEEETLYERLGEQEGIRAVVDDFYDRLVADDDLGPYFEGADVDSLRRTQTDFLCEAAGGPETYDATPVEEAHIDVPFTPADIQRAVELLYESLDAFDVPEEDADLVVEAVAAREDDLLAGPGDGGGGGGSD